MMIPVDILPELRRIAASPGVVRMVEHLRRRLRASVGIALDSVFWWIGAKQDFQLAHCESWAETHLLEIRDYRRRLVQAGENTVWLDDDDVRGLLVPIRRDNEIVAAVVILHEAGMHASAAVGRDAIERECLAFWGAEIAASFEIQMPGHLAAGFESAAMQQVAAQMAVWANDDAPVLICGGPGCGKKYAARMIHLMGNRARSPFIIQKLQNSDDEMLLSELVGYRRGAFAWAIQDKVGLLDVAAGGTIVIEEIGELSMNVQSWLLDLIETHAVTAFGDKVPHALDIRLMATSSVDLEDLVKHQKFRRDLYAAFQRLDIPPLAAHIDDLPGLANAFMSRRCMQLNRPVRVIPDEILDIYRHYGWPGNVRELRSEIERLAIMVPPDTEITPDLIHAHILASAEESDNVPAAAQNGTISIPSDMAIQDALIYVEKMMLSQALAQNGGNRTKTAEMLGISRRNLIRKIENLGI